MTADLVAFLRARLDEDEQVARAASPGPWRAHDVGDGRANVDRAAGARLESFGFDRAAVVADEDGMGAATTVDAEHVARWDPARVLAEVAAKRAILGWHAPTGSRDPETCGLCPHGRAIHPGGGACVDRDCDCQGYDDDRELMYPEAARLCGFCGPGDNWPARDPEDFPHALWPCKHVRLLAQPYAGHPEYQPSWAT